MISSAFPVPRSLRGSCLTNAATTATAPHYPMRAVGGAYLSTVSPASLPSRFIGWPEFLEPVLIGIRGVLEARPPKWRLPARTTGHVPVTHKTSPPSSGPRTAAEGAHRKAACHENLAAAPGAAREIGLHLPELQEALASRPVR